MATAANGNRYRIICVKGKLYVQTWKYKKKDFNTKGNRISQYDWQHIGAYGSDKVNDWLESISFTQEEYEEMEKEYIKKKTQLDLINRKLSELSHDDMSKEELADLKSDVKKEIKALHPELF